MLYIGNSENLLIMRIYSLLEPMANLSAFIWKTKLKLKVDLILIYIF